MVKKDIKIITHGLGLVVLVAISIGAYLTYRSLDGAETFDRDFYDAEVAENSEFSYKSYDSVLKKYVNDDGMVSYSVLKDQPEQLEQFVRALGSVDLNTYKNWNENARIVFWINAYNALTLKVIIDHYPIKAGLISGLVYPNNSIRQISGVWDKIRFLVMGRKLTLNEIEHGILRGQDKDFVEAYGKFYEPRIHMALVCAAIGCPPLRNESYIGEKLDEQLNDQSKIFLANPDKFRIDQAESKVSLSSIFKWFGKDFVKKYKPDIYFDSAGGEAEKSVLHFISQHIQPEQADYLRTGKYQIHYLDYDWTLNEQKDGQTSNTP
jgi:hypothetical protein